MKILVFSNFKRTNAVYQLRFAMYHDFFKSKNLVSKIWYNEIERIYKADLIILHRFVKLSSDVLKNIIDSGCSVLLETDDQLLEMNDNHPNFSLTLDVLPLWNIYRYLVTGITVSTDYLSKYFQEYNDNIAVIKNTLPLKQADGYRKNNKLKIVFAGTDTHQHDFAFLKNPLKKILGLGVEIVCFGYVPDFLEGLPGVQYHPFDRNYLDYIENLVQFKGDSLNIGLAPLQINSFNKAKSSIKYLEYTYAGIVGIYSDIEPYRNIKGGIVLKNDPDLWYRELKNLIENNSILEKNYKEALKQNSKEYKFETEAWKLWDLYSKIVKETKKNDTNKIISLLLKEIEQKINLHDTDILDFYTKLQSIKLLDKENKKFHTEIEEIITKRNTLDHIKPINIISLFKLYDLYNLKYSDIIIKKIKEMMNSSEMFMDNADLIFFLLNNMFKSARYSDIAEIIINNNMEKLESIPVTLLIRVVLLKLKYFSENDIIRETEFNFEFTKFEKLLTKYQNNDNKRIEYQGMGNYYAGVFYKKKGDMGKCLGFYKVVLDCLEKNQDMNVIEQYRLASVQRDLGNYEDSINSYNKVIALSLSEGTKSGAYFNIGVILEKKGEIKKAKYNFSLCLKLNPYHRKAREYLEK